MNVNENNTTINIKENIKESLREGQEIVESNIRNAINVYL